MKNTLLSKIMPLLVLFFSGILSAQTVTGVVSDATGPLPGVNIVVKGTTNGTQTDFDGNYSLNNVASDATLVFSYVGFTTKEVPVNGRSSINVQLEEDAAVLDEIVVIGYGTTTVKDATGAVASVSAEDFNQGVIASPEQLIQGKAPGVQITQTSGQPGAGIDIRIRGTNSIRSNNNPLFVVDGIPLSGDNVTAEGVNVGVGSSPGNNPLNFLNPNDIESISVLQDASSTAIYGSRGANGVVIITTKSGKGAVGSRWDFSSNIAYSSVRNEYDLLSPEQFIAESQAAGLGERDFGARTDWQDYIFRTSASTNQNLAYSNNYETGNLRATFGYTNQNGVVENSSLERIAGRLNINQKLFEDKLLLTFQGTLSRINDEIAPIGGNAGSTGDLIGGIFLNPTVPTDPDFPGLSRISPATALTYAQDLTFTNRYLLNFSANYDITSQLSAKINLGLDKSDSSREASASAKAIQFGSAFGNGIGAISELDTQSNLLEATLTYKKEFENSSVEILGGYSFQDFQRSGAFINGYGYGTTNLDAMASDLNRAADILRNSVSGDYQQIGFASNYNNSDSNGIYINRLFDEEAPEFVPFTTTIPVEAIAIDTFDNTTELQSFFGRVKLSFANKYLFTGTVRADGSSRFGEDNQYGYFPSGAFAWKISEEDFVGDNVSTLKLRLNAGITGNQEGLGYGNFVRRNRFGGGNPIDGGGSITVPTIGPVAFAEPSLKWEETFQYGAGLDFGFNNNRLYGSLDVYRKSTSDLLLRIQSAQPAVQPTVFANLDTEIINQGVTFALGYNIFDNEDFSWGVDFNLNYNDNVIEKLVGEFDAGTIYGQGLTNAFAQKLAEGQPLFSFFLREFEGFDQQNGQPIQNDTQVFVGKSALPDVTGGFNTNLRYKDWSFAAFFTGQFGHYVYNNTFNAFNTAGAFGTGGNVTTDVLETGEGLNAAADVSTRFLEKGDFVRLQNASLSYNVPLADQTFFKSFMVSLTGQNLFVITDYSGLDPEVSNQPATGDVLNGLPTAGIDYTAYPRPRTILFGINATF